MMTRDPRLLYATRLLELHAAGHFGLPEELIEAGAKLEAMRAATKEAGATSDVMAPGNVVERLAREMLEAGSRPKRSALEATVAAIDEAERRQRVAGLAVQVTRRALEIAELALAAALDEHRDEILGQYLAPALRERSRRSASRRNR